METSSPKGATVPRFRPAYIFENELSDYGLPDVDSQPQIMSLVRNASTLIDEYCGRTDGNGNGSLVYCTYAERLDMRAKNRNIVRVSFKPLAVVTPTTVSELAASGASNPKFNYYDTKVTANTILRPDGTPSPIISAEGRYGYPRRGDAAIYPDLNYGMNLLQVAAFFGGPPGFLAMDVSSIDFYAPIGEIWVPAGLYMSQYTELHVVYNSGYDPRDMPPAIKDACAAVIRNYIAKGGTTGTKSIQAAGAISVQISELLIDPTIETWLAPYKTVTSG